jgi:hypothetical protein
LHRVAWAFNHFHVLDYYLNFKFRYHEQLRRTEFNDNQEFNHSTILPLFYHRFIKHNN